jgi:lipopolysaccharide export system protein LptA
MKRVLTCVLIVVCSTGAESAQNPRREPVVIESNTQTVQGELARFVGKARAEVMGLVIQADEILLNQSTQLLSAQGNVVLTAGKASLTLPNVQVDLRNLPSELCRLAAQAVDRGQFEGARSLYQAVVNLYPDSEFLDDAKAGIGDASLREGSEAALKQAEAEFVDFITFFPDSPLLGAAQLKLAETRERLRRLPGR